MKGIERKNQLFSLCGLNCGLCPMLLGSYCGGCGNGNQSCKIAKCSLEHGEMEYCYECKQYPCEKYQHIDESELPFKEQCSYVAEVFQKIADRRNIKLKLIKKK